MARSPAAAGSIEPHIVKRVRTGSGRVLYQRPQEAAKIVIAVRDVGAINDMLNSALVAGTGRRAALLLHPACGKTGTAQEFRDAWFIGYTAHYVGGVWVGNDDRHSMNRVMGGNLPAKLWHDIMVLAHAGRTPTALPGTTPTAPLAQAPPSQAPPERSGSAHPAAGAHRARVCGARARQGRDGACDRRAAPPGCAAGSIHMGGQNNRNTTPLGRRLEQDSRFVIEAKCFIQTDLALE